MNATRLHAGLVLACAIPLCGGCSRVSWRLGLDRAMDVAAREDRLVLVYYAHAFNEDCERMDRTVFRSNDVLTQMRDMIPVRLDATFEKKRAAQLGLRDVPSFVVIAPNGEVLRQGSGPMDVDQFLAFLVMAKLNR